MSELITLPIELPYDFWDNDSLEFGNSPEFFLIPIKKTDQIASIGWWNGQDILWLLEFYHASSDYPEPVYYTLDPIDSEMEEVSKEAWFKFVKEQTPQCISWILFRLEELSFL